MAITREDIEACRKLLAVHAETQTCMTEEEYIARKLGDISRNRAARLIIATRQNITTRELKR